MHGRPWKWFTVIAAAPVALLTRRPCAERGSGERLAAGGEMAIMGWWSAVLLAVVTTVPLRIAQVPAPDVVARNLAENVLGQGTVQRIQVTAAPWSTSPGKPHSTGPPTLFRKTASNCRGKRKSPQDRSWVSCGR